MPSDFTIDRNGDTIYIGKDTKRYNQYSKFLLSWSFPDSSTLRLTTPDEDLDINITNLKIQNVAQSTEVIANHAMNVLFYTHIITSVTGSAVDNTDEGNPVINTNGANWIRTTSL